MLMTRPKVNAEIRTITPEMAQEMLRNNPCNRSLSRTVVAAYQRDMELERWQVNGEGLQFDQNGALLNGQHRLTACVRANTPFRTLVVTGLAPDIRDTIDGGKKRTHGDRLQMRGVKNANVVSSTARMAWSLAYNRIRMPSLTPQDLDWFIDKYPQTHDSVAKCHLSFGGLQSAITTVHLVGTLLGYEDRADAMIDVWRSGVPDYSGCPMHVFREKLLKSRGTTQEITPDKKVMMLLSAWERFRHKKPTHYIRLAKEPEIKGWTPRFAGLDGIET